MRILVTAVVLSCFSVAVGSGQGPAFSVASVKPVNLAAHPVFGNRGGPGTADPGRIHLCCVGMFSLLMRAYDVEIDQIIGPYCPECGAKALQRDWFRMPSCSSCGKEMRRGKGGRRYGIRNCTHCGVPLDKKGI